MCLRELRAQQAQGDMEHDLRKEVDPQARRAIRARAHRRIAAHAPRQYWERTARRLLTLPVRRRSWRTIGARSSPHLSARTAALSNDCFPMFAPLTLQSSSRRFPSTTSWRWLGAHVTRHLAPTECTTMHGCRAGRVGGLLILYKAYLAVLAGDSVPGWINASLVVFIPKSAPGSSGMPHAATPVNFRPISLSNTSQKLIAKALNMTLEVISQDVAHPAQRGFIRGRQMGDNILLTLASMEKALILGAHSFGTRLFDISAAFPSVAWERIWALLEAVSLPIWVVRVWGLMEGSEAQVYLNGRFCDGASFAVRRGIRQGCLTSGSLWALFFDPVVRCLTAALPSPHDSLTCFADDWVSASALLCPFSSRSPWRQDYCSTSRSAPW